MSNDFTPSTNDFRNGADVPPTGTCTVPPSGWWCSRTAGHSGPCAARQATRDDYTPDTDEVCDAFVDFRVDHSKQPLTHHDAAAQFYRWLAAHNAKIRTLNT